MEKLKIVTIGGGSSYTPELIEGFIKRYDSLPIGEIWLVDVEAGREKLEIVGGLARRMVEKAGLDIKIQLSLDRRAALKDADFVTTQLRVGQLAARERDERIPLSRGLMGQETNGAGGMLKAFRTIPVMLDIAADIKDMCPNAWVINFTNPSGMVTEALIKYSGLSRVIGLCNVPIHMEMNIAKSLGVDVSRLQITFAGLNHLVHGMDVFLDGERITDQVLEFYHNPDKNIESVRNVSFKHFDKDFITGLGVIPCPYHNYYFKSGIMLEEELAEFEKRSTRASVVQEVERQLFEVYQNPELSDKPTQLEQRGGAFYSDAACRLIDSIYNDKRDIQPVDVRNNGAIRGIDDDCVVEVSSVITKKGPIPLNIGKLPVAVNGLVQQLKAFEILTIEAAVEGNYQKAMTALTINPLTPSDQIAKIVLDELMEAHREYLPQFKL